MCISVYNILVIWKRNIVSMSIEDREDFFHSMLMYHFVGKCQKNFIIFTVFRVTVIRSNHDVMSTIVWTLSLKESYGTSTCCVCGSRKSFKGDLFAEGASKDCVCYHTKAQLARENDTPIIYGLARQYTFQAKYLQKK